MEERKEEYQKPQLIVIDLKADEVLGTGCKTEGGGGPVEGPCLNSCSGFNAS